MIRIHCPHCGLRDHDEFSYVGDATKIRPNAPAAASPEDWHRHVYLRDNPRGPQVVPRDRSAPWEVGTA